MNPSGWKRGESFHDFPFYVGFIYAVGGPEFNQRDAGLFADIVYLAVSLPSIRRQMSLIIDLDYKKGSVSQIRNDKIHVSKQFVLIFCAICP